MKILVVGGTRYMGKHLVNALLAKGHETSATIITANGHDQLHQRSDIFIENNTPKRT